MKKISHIGALFLLGIGGILLPLTLNAQATQTSSSLTVGAPDANGQSTVSQSSSVTTPSATYQYQSGGLFSCNKTGAAASSVGAFAASGSYVPVSDAAVELNTGYLVYLDCSLRPLVSALSQSATAGLVQKIVVSFNTGDNGNPQFSVNLNNEEHTISINTFVNAVQGGALNSLNPALKSPVQAQIVQQFSAGIEQPNSALACPYTGNLSTLLGGQFSEAGLDALVYYPTCNPLGAQLAATDLLNGYVANANQNYQTQLGWSQGALPITTTDANGNVNVVTPGAIVMNQAQQALQAGLVKTEDANDIGQMVGQLFAGIGAQAVSSVQGLAGITQSSGAPSYLSQAVAAASQNLQTNTLNTAINVLNGVLTTVTNYENSLNGIGQTLTQAINTLKGDEAQCWNSIIQAACVPGSIRISNGAETCTQVPQAPIITTNGVTTQTPSVTLTIATSSLFSFSNAVIQSQIAPLVRSTAANIQSAQGALSAVNQLVAGVTNTTSQAAQTQALQELDQLTASNSFPQPTDMANAQQQASSIATSMGSLLTQVLQNWQGIDSNGQQDISWDGTYSASTVGWCDYNDQRTLLMWEGVWKSS